MANMQRPPFGRGIGPQPIARPGAAPIRPGAVPAQVTPVSTTASIVASAHARIAEIEAAQAAYEDMGEELQILRAIVAASLPPAPKPVAVVAPVASSKKATDAEKDR